jgi:hypothetical protein
MDAKKSLFEKNKRKNLAFFELSCCCGLVAIATTTSKCLRFGLCFVVGVVFGGCFGCGTNTSYTLKFTNRRNTLVLTTTSKRLR